MGMFLGTVSCFGPLLVLLCHCKTSNLVLPRPLSWCSTHCDPETTDPDDCDWRPLKPPTNPTFALRYSVTETKGAKHMCKHCLLGLSPTVFMP